MRLPILFGSLLCVFSGGLGADTLVPFEAEYRISVNRIPTPIRAELRLVEEEREDHYRMEFQIHSRLMQNTETTRFIWRDCNPRTEQYNHQFRGFGRQRDHQMDFFWEEPAQVVTTSVSGRRGEAEFEAFEIPQETLDDLTMLLKTRCLITEGKEYYTVKSAYGSGVREHEVRLVGSEVLDTPMGELETLMVERVRERDRRRGRDRHTMFWIAPALDYMLVRARHVEDSGLYGEITMRSYNGPINPDAHFDWPDPAEDSLEGEDGTEAPAHRADVPCSGTRQGHAALPHVLARPIPVGGFADLVRLQKQHLRHSLVGINLRRQGCGIGKLQGHMSLPLRLQRGHVNDDAAARISGFAKTDGQHIARNAEILDGSRQCKGVRRDDAVFSLDIDKALFVEVLRIHRRAVDIGEHLEFIGTTDVVPVAGDAVGNYLALLALANQLWRVRFDHALLFGHAANPFVRLDTHAAPG